jgi:iron complex outermembrane receptor protein
MGIVWRFAAIVFFAIEALTPRAHAQAKDMTGEASASSGVASPQDEPPEEVIITSRLREEDVQAVPVAVSVIGQQKLEDTGSYNVGLLAQLTPTVQFFSSNPRNTAITIRGLGTSFGLTNDGLEAGVGLYIDQVYMSRPAAATFDFIDVERVEVLRGPQGTLFGKNTTAGAINIVIREPTFERQIKADVSAGNYGFWQGKASISGSLAGTVLAGRLSVSGTLRDGTLHNVTSGKDVNNQNDFGTRAQLLYRPNDQFRLRLTGDYNRQQSVCCAQLFVRVGTTLKPAAQQFPALAAAAGYVPATLDPFDRLVDTNTPARANQVIGGISAIADWNLGPVRLTSVSAWRTWNWDPASDRDFTRLSIQTQSKNPDNQNQYSEELRVASNGKQTVDYVAGLYYFRQKIDATPIAEYGADATRWLLPQDLTLPANLLDGYRATGEAHSDTKSYAAFAQATWNITDNLHFTPGLRYTYEDKTGSFDQLVSAGMPPANANQLSRKNSIAREQHYSAAFSDGSLAGTANLAYDITKDIHAYVSYSRGHKSGGINLAGIPLDAGGNPIVTTAVVKPEDVSSYEIGLKNQFFNGRVTVNLAAFDTKVHNYQVNVVDSGPGALRGYLSNIDKVSSHGIELDSAFVANENLSGYVSAAWTEGKYVSFANGPCPLELNNGATVACNLSGRPLPGLSKWVVSAGGEYRHSAFDGMAYFGVDASYRTSLHSDAADSKYLRIDGYSLVNVRVGYISSGPWEASVWVKNLFDTDYFQYLSAQAGNSGAVFGLPGDPRTFGVTFRVRY